MPPRTRRWRRYAASRPLFLLVVAFALVLSAYLGAATVRISRTYEQLLEAKTLLLTTESELRQDGLAAGGEDLDRAETRFLAARANFQSASDSLSGEPVLRLGRHLPGLGGQIDAAATLAGIGVRGSDIGLGGVEVLRRFEQLQPEDERPAGEAAAEFLEDVAPGMERINGDLEAIRSARRTLSAPLLGPLAGAVEAVDGSVAVVGGWLKRYDSAREVVRPLLGFDRPRRYLVLGQDNTELFPTGGIIAVYGTVTFDQGYMVERSFHSGTALVDEWRDGGAPYVAPPPPLYRYLLRNWSWNFVLSNWSPDFPTAARQALWFYGQAGGEPVDGVIGIDFAALEGLLAVTGPLTLDEYGMTLDAGNITEQVLTGTIRPLRPGDHAHAVATAAAARVLDAAFAVDGESWDELLLALDRLATEKHLLVYSADERLQPGLRELGWDGSLAPLASDWLMPVEASVHSTKLDLVIEREVRLRVALDAAGGARNELTLRYRNRLDGWAAGREADVVSSLMLDGFYGGYLRLLAPPQARLSEVSVDGRPAGVEEVGRESGRASFGRYFPLPRGAARDVTFSYAVPGVVRDVAGEKEYRLLIQKQAGLREPPLRISIELPAGAHVLSVWLDNRRLDGEPLEIETDLARDRELVVRYRE